MPLVLVVEDEANILKLLAFNLTKEGYQVVALNNGQAAVNFMKKGKPDLIILDIMLPKVDGYEILRMLREKPETSAIPVIILSAKGEILDRVLGLELGADDYITKPFSPREVLARVKSQLRRKTSLRKGPQVVEENVVRYKRLVIKPEKYEASMEGEKLDLTPKEFELLHLLAMNPGRVFTRDLLLEKIWGYEHVRETRTVDVHIRYLRQKIEKDPAEQEYIETVRGVGYRLRSMG
ncbi:MAG: response regulator transcription factor [Desulfotomaculaceae bacterium]|nr:response regulator transcription factor [Desulfotomaculaceae bacterium]